MRTLCEIELILWHSLLLFPSERHATCSQLQTLQSSMARSKLRFQLVCVWALCLMCPTLSEDHHTCLVETDGEPDDLYALALAAKDEEFIKMCGKDLHISVMWPYKKKLDTLKVIFHFLEPRSLHIYEGATSAIDTSTNLPDHNQKIVQGNSQASIAITKLLSTKKSIYILIIGPCTTLATGMKNVKGNVPFQEHVKEIFWLGGFKEEGKQYMTSYNWYRDIEATEYILQDTILASKITVVMSRESHMYHPGLTPNNFRPFYEKLSHLENDKVMRHVNLARREWMEHFMKNKIKQITDISSPLEIDLADEVDKTQNVCAADIVAALVMFHPKLVKEMKLIEYKLHTTKKKETEAWDTTEAIILSPPMIKHPMTFASPNINMKSGIYTNKFITEINDIAIDYSKKNTQPIPNLSPPKVGPVDDNFKKFVLYLLDLYSPK